MLVQLVIRDFALIDYVELHPGPGLNVLTGETGAGKSIIVDAMNLLVGGRASTELVRTGAEKACVEGLFDCTDYLHVAEKLVELGVPVSEDGTLLLSREVVREGRSLCRINGRIVPLAMYRSLGELLVDLHGQHEHQSLLRVGQHGELLDRYCGREVLQQRSLVADLYRRLVMVKEEYEQQQAHEAEVTRHLEYLRFAVAEIDRLKPRPGEEEELQQERERFRCGEKLAGLVKEALEELAGGGRTAPAYDLLSSAAQKLQEIGKLDGSMEELCYELNDIVYRLEDVVERLRSYQDRLEFDPQRAQEVEDRLFALRGLMRKYGNSLAEVCAFREQAAAEIEGMEGAAGRKEALADEYRRLTKEYDAEAKKLSSLRRAGAKRFVAAVLRELEGLGMENARLEIGWKVLSDPGPKGYDEVEFLFSANPGEPLKPLAKIASGGEMSRVMLALKVILAENDRIPTLIFDEIDAGIGGLTLQAVGERLVAVAGGKQVLCVTHAPQIAGRGQRHFRVEKTFSGERTCVSVRLLQEEERIDELVRMLGNSGKKEIARKHAREILNSNLSVNKTGR
ncbi:DNA recombination/repair protein RecN [Thermacetogenium phaeum DSM 12270]|uniref:DNA repair protein RecN n=1 Tax=Thermacetogenium phaeum (strain ATCC BAA-254 / DSM 26808 / PB) TaxID=1089553 RepID=K4LIG2_THEPS|nr:DNA repair protein RecN [Thermacetogenium phaeum]AFV11827.1 DNA recombination/repair protein RecN [Thermacetogenium phaeum DSM 12270]